MPPLGLRRLPLLVLSCLEVLSGRFGEPPSILKNRCPEHPIGHFIGSDVMTLPPSDDDAVRIHFRQTVCETEHENLELPVLASALCEKFGDTVIPEFSKTLRDRPFPVSGP